MAKMLNKDPDMIARMEADLMQKAAAAYASEAISCGVHGVFSLDDLESKIASDLCGGIAVGVGYAGAEATTPDAPLNVARGAAVAMADFRFLILLAVPSQEACAERHDATKLLTLLRGAILGSTIAGDVVNRAWVFVREKPEINESTSNMLYYSQVWRVAIPNTGNLNQQ